MAKICSQIAVMTSTLLSSMAFAQSGGAGSDWYSFFQNWWANFWNTWNSGGGQTGGGHSVPELDAATGPLAIALITVIVGIGLERNRRRKKQTDSTS